MMKKVEVFSKKMGKTFVVKPTEKTTAVMGWSNSGWNKSSGWKKPVL